VPIEIIETVEPFAMWENVASANLAVSPAYHRLTRDLERYSRGDISGRSFLIAGHRGSGKTTLVQQAIQDTLNALYRQTVTRPLRVPLHAPDLLPDDGDQLAGTGKENKGLGGNAEEVPKQIAIASKPEEENKSGEVGKNEQNPCSETERVLKQITIAFYRALADEVYQSYRQRALHSSPSGRAGDAEMLELAAQLLIELDGPVELEKLREFWSRVGALGTGVLYWRPPQSSPTIQEAISADQGMLELIAITSASQAYRRVAGELKESRKDQVEASSKANLELNAGAETKDLMKSVLGLLAGGAVGWALKDNSLTAVLAGIATAVTTTAVLKYSSVRSRADARSREVTFLADTTVASLDRMLPILVERCRRAGLAPIFVVDELDKVKDLQLRMGRLVTHLKHFVTERTFFCFLVDRGYLEALRRETLNSPYATEYTYFSERLLVLYRPADFHKYLNSIFRVVPSEVADELRENTLDREIIPYIILHRSRLHPFDIRRQVAKIRDDKGFVSIPRGTVRTQLAYRFDILVQVAVEWILEQSKLQERLTQDEEFTQVAYDTLYYPSRIWERGGAELDLSKDAFLRYIAQRVTPVSGAQVAADAEQPCILSALDQEFLLVVLRNLVSYLAHPDQLKAEISSTNPSRFSSTVLDALPVEEEYRLLEHSKVDRYTWRYDIFGRSVQPLGIESVLTAQLERDAALVEAMETAVAKLSNNGLDLNNLSLEFHILSSTPAWPIVREALVRLRRLQWRMESAEPYAEMEQDSNAVWEFARMLRESMQTLSLALVTGRILGEFTNWTMIDDKLVGGIKVLAEQLSLSQVSLQQTHDKLTDAYNVVMQTVMPGAPLPPFHTADEPEAGDVPAWESDVLQNQQLVLSAGAPQLDRAKISQYNDALSQIWLDRFSRFLRDGRADSKIHAEDLFCAAAKTGAATVMRVNLADMTILEWSRVIVLSAPNEKGEDGSVPLPFLFAAIVQLGFPRIALELLGEENLPGDSRLKKVPEQFARLKEWALLTQQRFGTVPPARPAAIVIAMPGSAVITQWKPSARNAAFALSSEASKYDVEGAQEIIERSTKAGSTARLFMELAVDDPDLLFKLRQRPSVILPTFASLDSLPYSYILARNPGQKMPPDLPTLIAPQTLDEAMDKSYGESVKVPPRTQVIPPLFGTNPPPNPYVPPPPPTVDVPPTQK
jgi:hypothetical protein